MERDYALLGVTRNVSEEKLKQAFRKKAMQHHPDRVQGDKKVAAEKKFKEISQAYENIQKHRKEGGSRATAQRGTSAGYARSQYQTRRPPNVYDDQGGSSYYSTGKRGTRARAYGEQFRNQHDSQWWDDMYRRQRAHRGRAGSAANAPWMREFLKEEEQRRVTNAKWTRRAWLFTMGVTALWIMESLRVQQRRRSHELKYPLMEAWYNPLRERWEKPQESGNSRRGQDIRYKPVHMVWDPDHPERFDPGNADPPDYSGLAGVIAPGPTTRDGTRIHTRGGSSSSRDGPPSPSQYR